MQRTVMETMTFVSLLLRDFIKGFFDEMLSSIKYVIMAPFHSVVEAIAYKYIILKTDRKDKNEYINYTKKGQRLCLPI